MNDPPPATGRVKWPTMGQWWVIVWVMVLNAAPYVLTYIFPGLVIVTMLSAPFAHTGMLAFFLMAGGLPIFTRRLMLVAGQLFVVSMVMCFVGKQAVGSVIWFTLEVIAMLAICLASGWVVGVPRPPRKWSLQFSLAEFLAKSGLLGIFLVMLRLGNSTGYQFWQPLQDTELVAFAICSGIFLLPICLATIVTGRVTITGMIVFGMLLCFVYPFLMLGTLIVLDRVRLLTHEQFLFLFYLVFPIQLLLAWGTYFPLRAWLPGVLSMQSFSETNVEARSPDEQDFASMT